MTKTERYREEGMIPEVPSRDPTPVTLPPHYPDTPEIRQDWVTYMDIVTAMDKQIGDWLEELDDEGLRDNTIASTIPTTAASCPRNVISTTRERMCR